MTALRLGTVLAASMVLFVTPAMADEQIPDSLGVLVGEESASLDSTVALVPEREVFSVMPAEKIFPPRMFSAPTGKILPSLSVYAASGWTAGFTEKDRGNRWVLSFGVGGVGEVTVASSRITHITSPSSDALAGFRVRAPLGWLNEGLGRTVSLALNLAATDQTSIHAGSFEDPDGQPVGNLSYTYRETTLGFSATVDLGRTQLNGVAHLTDLRAENIQYEIQGKPEVNENQQELYPSFSLGLEYAANLNTHVLLEARTLPQVLFYSGPGELRVNNNWEAIAGLRFFPVSILGFDATVSIDDTAIGIADMEIGFGLHVLLSPSLTKKRG